MWMRDFILSQNIYAHHPSSIWKFKSDDLGDEGFFPKWMRQNGFDPSKPHSLEGWKCMFEACVAEANTIHKNFLQTHEELMRSGRWSETVHVIASYSKD